MLAKVEAFVDHVRGLSVAVVGETIIDQFIPVSYEGQSMKSICPVFKLEGGVLEQTGGAGAIAGHLKPFVKSLDFITNESKEIIKTRYVDVDDKKKHVEINRFENHKFKEITVNTSDYDVVIVADFGHGFCDKLDITKGFHLMCQTNSNNFGFNRVSKWKHHKKQSVCLDLREANLQMNKKINKSSRQHILALYNYEMNSRDLFLTLGYSGSAYTNGKMVSKLPIFKTNIVDTIGAGDTFFAFSTLASHMGLPSEDIMLVPSLAASLSTTWLCNENSVTPELLLKHANRYLRKGVQKAV